MCVVALAWKAHPRWSLVLAGNRDELHARPSTPVQRWPDAPHLTGGRDLVSGGLWLGQSSGGRVAVVTNIAGEAGPNPQLQSRGQLVKHWLDGHGPDQGPALADLNEYNPFNLLILSNAGLFQLSNRPQPERRALPPGVHSVSNGVSGMAWPRRDYLEGAMIAWLAGSVDDPAFLFDVLALDHWPSASAFANPHAPVFIRNARYGTRCSTVVALDHGGKGWMAERRFDSTGALAGESHVALSNMTAGAGGGT